MAMISFAFSIHNFISSVGADAGFAAIIGLAVLVLLYFAHARETANLREEAAMLTERLQEAEARVAQLTGAQDTATPQTTSAPAPAAAAATAPFAPAGTGAPALAAATRVVPLVAPVSPSSVESPLEPPADRPPAPPQAVPAPQPPVAAPVPAMAAAAASPSVSPAAAPAAPAGQAAQVPAPATAAGGNGAGHRPTAPPPVRTDPGWAPPGGRAPGRPLLGDLPPLAGPDRTRRSRFGRGLAVALGALAVVAAAVVLVAVTSLGGSPNSHPAASTTNAPGPSRSPVPAFKPSSVTVAVLNGTSTNRLAHRIGAKLAAIGYKQGTIATAANQTETTTVVAYRPGVTNRTDARHVAEALGLGSSAVRPVDQSTLQVACPVSTSCADVVVTVGADLASP